ncbi:MAG: tRNA lysidine(34) synthetase TilS [Microthrixaceae bacterium]
MTGDGGRESEAPRGQGPEVRSGRGIGAYSGQECEVQERLGNDPFVAELLGRCRFPANAETVTCGVSGGADSSALLILAVAAGFNVTAVHVDHALRDGSEREADVVRSLATRFGADFRSLTCPVSQGPDLEARAREVRLGALPDDVLLGHTADDQAETVVMRLLRGTGPSGLAAMGWDHHPLLAIRRSEVEALCQRLDIVPFEDPSNNDKRFLRNRVRHEVMPLLSEVANRDVAPLMCRLAELSAAQASFIEEMAEKVDPTDAKNLASLHPTLGAAVIRRWWLEATKLDHPPDAAAIARILDVAAGRIPGCDVLRGWSVRRSKGRLALIGPSD